MKIEFCEELKWWSFIRYFEDDDEDGENLEYQPAPGSPSFTPGEDGNASDESDDPLEAFMAGIEVCMVIHIL